MKVLSDPGLNLEYLLVWGRLVLADGMTETALVPSPSQDWLEVSETNTMVVS